MRSVKRLVGAAASVFVVGLGQALAGRRRAAITWALARLVTTELAIVSVWFGVVSLTIALAGAIDAYQCMTKAERIDLLDPIGLALVPIFFVTLFATRALVVEGYRIPTSSMYPTLWLEDRVYVDKLSPHWHPIEPGEIAAFVYPCDHDDVYVKRVIAVAGDRVELRCSKLYVNDQLVPEQLVTETYDYEDRLDAGDWVTAHASEYRERLGGHDFDVLYDPNRPARDRQLAAGNYTQRAPHDFPLANDNPFPPSCGHAPPSAERSREREQVVGKLVVTKPAAVAQPCELQAHYVVPPDSLFVLGDNRANSNDSRVWGALPVSLLIGRVKSVFWHGGRGSSWSRIGGVE